MYISSRVFALQSTAFVKKENTEEPGEKTEKMVLVQYSTTNYKGFKMRTVVHYFVTWFVVAGGLHLFA